jgi:hypothetical protein
MIKTKKNKNTLRCKTNKNSVRNKSTRNYKSVSKIHKNIKQKGGLSR